MLQLEKYEDALACVFEEGWKQGACTLVVFCRWRTAMNEDAADLVAVLDVAIRGLRFGLCAQAA